MCPIPSRPPSPFSQQYVPTKRMPYTEFLSGRMIQFLLIYPDPPANSLASNTGKKDCANKLPSPLQRELSPSGLEKKKPGGRQGWGKLLCLALPLWDQGVDSSFHSRRGSSLFQLKFCSLPLAPAQEKEERGKAAFELG